MKQNTQAIALMAILAIGSGIAGFSLASQADSNPAASATGFVVKPMMSGHLQVEVHDADGNLKAVRSADNIITQQGENCALRLLFTDGSVHDAAASSGDCAGPFQEPFTYIAVGTGTTQEVGTQYQLVSETNNLGGNSNFDRKAATTVTWTNSSGTEPTQSAQIVIAATFSNAGAGASITEAGLFNSTKVDNTDAMFARKTFAGVTVNDGDSLTVTWTIKVGNTTNFD